MRRKTNTYITYLENEKLHKKKIQEIDYRNLYDENNHLIGIQKSVKILTSEETFDMITYEYTKCDRLVKIGAYFVCAGIAAISMPGARAVAGAATCVILLIDILN